MQITSSFNDFLETYPYGLRIELKGRVVGTEAGLIVATTPLARIGEIYSVPSKGREFFAQVISFSKNKALLAPLEDIEGLAYRAEIVSLGIFSLTAKIPSSVFDELNNISILNSLGKPLINDKVLVGDKSCVSIPLFANPPSPISRLPNNRHFLTGLRSIDYLLPLAYGQRIGLFAGAGVGKSSLLGMIANFSRADVVVVALVGERGREINEFIQKYLSSHNSKKTIIVTATSDESAMMRGLAPYTATGIAEYYRAQGKDVLLLVDSLTRMGRAWRDIAVAGGELPTLRGFPTSVFTRIPKLLERAGNSSAGSITAVYTILSSVADGDYDTFGEEIKSLLDGHVVLDKELAESRIYPAISITRSVSRLASSINSLTEIDEEARQQITRAIAHLERDKDLIIMGGKGDEELTQYLKYENDILSFLIQKETQQAFNERERFLNLALQLRVQKSD
jgi:FliI/YscN family ATPase